LKLYPDEPRLYRHRCHRYLTIREFDRALADFKKGAVLIEDGEDSIEPDGAPNAANIPIYTRHSTIWYHLGLAYYFTHDFENAHKTFQNGKDLHVNNDMEVSFSHWNYMTLRRLGRDQEAQATVATIPDDIVVYESQAYLQLIDLYKGKITVDELWQNTSLDDRSSAFTYGIANWYLYNGDTERAFDMMSEIAQPYDFTGYGWGAFGFFAAEADLKMRK
jgi:tetratricopeptide (TPR) repeat protein